MAKIDVSKYTLTEFDLTYALAGGVLFAQVLAQTGVTDDETVYDYYRATDFDNKSGDKRYPYRAKIEGVYYNFNASGISYQGYYTLFCAPDESNVIVKQGSLDKLNYVETVALQILNAIADELPNPETLSFANIKAITKKAFEFSTEFVNQAYDLRMADSSGSGSGSGSGGDEGVLEYIPSESLSGLSAVRKIVWCTEYPVEGLEGTVYIKLKKIED
ncbi:MAG: hypothetical protein II661_01185 [Bacteroidales bacterium]|nr:hypothetical protein [Bacteroidales bacterium]